MGNASDFHPNVASIIVYLSHHSCWVRWCCEDDSLAAVGDFILDISFVTTTFKSVAIMDPLHIIILLSVLLISLLPWSSLVDAVTAIAFPNDTTAISGDTISFHCIIEEPPDEDNVLEWYIDWDNYDLLKYSAHSNDVITGEEYAGHGSYRTEYRLETMPGQNGSRTHFCSITITNSTHNDTGYFGCTHRILNNNFRTLLAEKARLFVYQLPGDQYPLCEQTVEDGRDFATITCSSMGGIPPASLSWYNEENTRISMVHNHSVVSYIPIEYYARQFMCSATHPAFAGGVPKSCFVVVAAQTTTPAALTTTISVTNYNVTDNSTDDNVTGTVTPTTLPPREQLSDDRNFIMPIIIGVCAFCLLIFLLLVILFSLACRKPRRKPPPLSIPDSSSNHTTSSSVETQDTLPSLENPSRPAPQENAYSDIGRARHLASPPPNRPTSPPPGYDDVAADEDEDPGPILKPWTYHPDMLTMLSSGVDNGGYETADEARAGLASSGASGDGVFTLPLEIHSNSKYKHAVLVSPGASGDGGVTLPLPSYSTLPSGASTTRSGGASTSTRSGTVVRSGTSTAPRKSNAKEAGRGHIYATKL